MSSPGARPLAVVAAAVVIGGLASAVWPQHGLSIVHIVTVTAAAAAGLHAVAANTARGTVDVWRSPLTRLVQQPKVPALPSDLERTLSYLSTSRIRHQSVALPWGTARQLNRTAEAALERRGIDLDNPSHHAAARALVSPLTWAVATYDRNRVRGARRSPLRADSPGVARIVHAVLDDLDRLAGEGQGEGERRRLGGRAPEGTTRHPIRGSR